MNLYGLATGLLERLRIAQFFQSPVQGHALVRVEGRTAPAGSGAAPRRDALRQAAQQGGIVHSQAADPLAASSLQMHV
jgi:hypothetical protein